MCAFQTNLQNKISHAFLSSRKKHKPYTVLHGAVSDFRGQTVSNCHILPIKTLLSYIVVYIIVHNGSYKKAEHYKIILFKTQ